MEENELLEAMRPGSTNPRDERESNDLGRFGLGLKTASFSQCKSLTVVSRQGGEFFAARWDFDLINDDSSSSNCVNKWYSAFITPITGKQYIAPGKTPDNSQLQLISTFVRICASYPTQSTKIINYARIYHT